MPMTDHLHWLAKVLLSIREESPSNLEQYVLAINFLTKHDKLCTQGMKDMRADMGKISKYMGGMLAIKFNTPR